MDLPTIQERLERDARLKLIADLEVLNNALYNLIRDEKSPLEGFFRNHSIYYKVGDVYESVNLQNLLGQQKFRLQIIEYFLPDYVAREIDDFIKHRNHA